METIDIKLLLTHLDHLGYETKDVRRVDTNIWLLKVSEKKSKHWFTYVVRLKPTDEISPLDLHWQAEAQEQRIPFRIAYIEKDAKVSIIKVEHNV